MTDSPGLQTVLKRFLPDYQHTHPLDARRRQVCQHISQCRTPALGGLQLDCDHCESAPPLYHACRDRHCPKCQLRAARLRCERQQQSVLPVTYYHLVFTLPNILNGWVQLHPAVIYRRLFQAAWETLKAFAADPKRLGGELGMTAVLHTWGQNRSQHVHLHCLAPGGVLTEQGHWRCAKGSYLFPVRALSRHFRGRLLSLLRQSAKADELDRVSRPGEVDNVLDLLMKTDWVVYSESCLSHTNGIVTYLARYSHRIAISDGRIVSIAGDQVRFRYKDYADKNREKLLPLSGEEFIRRFLLHVLPKGLMRIRHYGFLANRCRKAKLAQIRTALAQGVE